MTRVAGVSARVTPIVALDVPDSAAALSLVDSLGDLCRFYKVGSELFTATGPEIVRALKTLGRLDFRDDPQSSLPLELALVELSSEAETPAARPTARPVAPPEPAPKSEPAPQFSFFRQNPAVLAELEKLDINALTPLEALTKLYELQKKAREE